MSKASKKRKTLLDFFSEKNKSTGNVNVDVAENVAASQVACNSNENTQNLTKEPDHSRGTDSIMVTIRLSNVIFLSVWEKFIPTLAMQKKLQMLKNIWIPDQSFNFPITTTSHRSLRFQYRWLIRFKWLAYSQIENGAFCKYCVLFGSKAGAGVENQTLGALYAVKFMDH